MKPIKKTYISLLVLPALALGACSDDDLLPGGAPSNPNAITFTAKAVRAADSRTRSGMPEYEPLELSGAGQTLYLHTYETNKVGFRPGIDSNSGTRANQIESADDLIKFHKTFKVLANRKDDGTNYFGWSETKYAGDNHSVWFTERTQYWPGSDELAFYAVSPASEFDNLKSLSVSPNEISFAYEAQTSNGGSKDAEAQPDLLLATSVCNKAGSVAGRAPLDFSHALSAIKFAVRDVLDGEVVSIEISGVNSKGNCLYANNDKAEGAVITWTGQSDLKSFTQTFNHPLENRPVVNPGDDSQDLLLSDKMPEKTFMMIPQQIPDDAKITVTLKRTNVKEGPETITVSGKIKDNLVTEWKPGHEYVYTISTSKSNWINVFAVGGNHNASTDNPKDIAAGNHNVTGGQYIYVYAPSYYKDKKIVNGKEQPNYLHDIYGDEAYMDVRSYRYRANNPDIVELLPWKASHGGTKQERVRSGGNEEVANRSLTAEEWMFKREALSGEGSSAEKGERKQLEFIAHHQMTTWPGDTIMQGRKEYSGISKEKPWDLSTCNGAISRTTANCYVIDRGGWYCFPLVYGNGYENGSTPTYFAKYVGEESGYTANNFVDYNGAKITEPDITQGDSADIVWSDVYNAVSDIDVFTYGGKRMIRFKANQYNMQQGSVIIALKDGDTVVWSWHIWITEHWLDAATGMPNVFKSDGDFAKYQTALGSGWREKGDVLIDNQHISKDYGYYIAPYNLGWCDPKTVDYLYRASTMEFVQYDKDGKETGLKASLPMIQDGLEITYKYGNNTYYQWGRKDPMVGFVDHEQTLKRNFGPMQYRLDTQPKSMAHSIQNPEVLFTGASTAGTCEDWCNDQRYNYWNNNDSDDVGIKTVYDPCPPGYMVPPGTMFEFIGPAASKYSGGNDHSAFYNDASNNTTLDTFNGERPDDYVFKAYAVDKKNGVESNAVWLPSTGHRWWKDNSEIGGVTYNGGDNFNPQIAYLWSSTVILDAQSQTNRQASHCGSSLALGYDRFDEFGPGNLYVICAHFSGRKVMARPVRPIRQQWSKTAGR